MVIIFDLDDPAFVFTAARLVFHPAFLAIFISRFAIVHRSDFAHAIVDIHLHPACNGHVKNG